MATPQEIVARDFMARKGYTDLEPDEIEELDRFRWAFFYDLPDGELELRVEWSNTLREWSASVEHFDLAS